MDIPKEILDITGKYNIVINNEKVHFFKQYGMGDILFLIILLKNKIISQLRFNLAFFNRNICDYFDDPINALEFRIRLLLEFKVKVDYIYNSNLRRDFLKLEDYMKKCTNFKLDISLPPPDINRYIIFHTKIRLGPEIANRISIIKNHITNICSTFKTDYTIILLGEKKFVTCNNLNSTFMTSAYEEMIRLKDNNRVMDLTKDSIHDDMNFDLFKSDLSIIKNAECNITFGWGGPFCLSLIFGKKCITYIDKINYKPILDKAHLVANDTFIYEDINKFKKNLMQYSINHSR